LRPRRATAEEDRSSESDVEDAPVVKFLHKMLLDAFNMRASDLHFEPYEHTTACAFALTASCAKSLAADCHQGQAGFAHQGDFGWTSRKSACRRTAG
jgi:hypothetical protein